MKKLTAKQNFWLSIITMVIGIVLLIWGSHIESQYPGFKAARRTTWLAIKSAGIQFILAIILLYGGYIYFAIIEKRR
jgi:hypothetical protein